MVCNEASTMTRIRDVVQQALTTGYLTVEAENQLRYLLTTHYDSEDLNAFMSLQEAAMNGKVKQESRERCGVK
ncbi:asl1243 [Nostoc sp. PCC 7120 = FACHB-418]|nr:asl1243 [Nostoc sp. PCC 7120 = FACHB-418]